MFQKIDDKCLDKWDDIPGYEHIYKINKYGEVYSCKNRRILKPYYGKVRLSKDSVRKSVDIKDLLVKTYPELDPDDVASLYVKGDCENAKEFGCTGVDVSDSWVDVPGFETMYQINRRNEVRSLSRIVNVKEGVYVKISCNVLPQYVGDDGRQYVKLIDNKCNVITMLIDDIVNLFNVQEGK